MNEFIKELITSGLLGSAETPNRKAQSEEHSDLLSARDAVPSQDEEDGETETPHLKADAMWKSHLICGHGSVHLEGVIGVHSC